MAANPVNPYYQWLGIPPEEQPANLYRLLGVKVFEANPDVIDAAADRQMSHLRRYQTGPDAALSQKLLNEVSAARITLLDPAKRAAYDRQLRSELAPQPAVPIAKPLQPSNTPVAAPVQSHPGFDAAAPGVAPVPLAIGPAKRRGAGGRPTWLIPALVGSGVAAVALVVLLLLAGGGGAPEGDQQTATRQSNSRVAGSTPVGGTDENSGGAVSAADAIPASDSAASAEESTPVTPPGVFETAAEGSSEQVATDVAPSMPAVSELAVNASLLKTIKGHQHWVQALAFSADATLLASSGTGGTVKLWSFPDGQPRGSFSGHTTNVESLAFSPDARLLASGDRSNIARIWDVQSGNSRFTSKAGDGWVESLAFSPDGSHLATVSAHTVRVWETASGNNRQSLKGDTGNVRFVTFLDNHIVLSAADRGVVKLWDLSSDTSKVVLSANVGKLNTAALSSDHRLIAFSDDDSGRLSVWNLVTGEQLPPLSGHRQAVFSVAFSPSGSILASGSRDHSAKLWDVRTGKQLARLEGHNFGVRAVQFSPDGRMLVTGSEDSTVKVWSLDVTGDQGVAAQAPELARAGTSSPLSLPASNDVASSTPPTTGRVPGSLAELFEDKPPDDATPRLPPPTAEQSQAVLNTLQETYNLNQSRNVADQLKLAGDLLKLARQSPAPAEQYVLFEQAAVAARDGGDARLVRNALDEFGKRFDVDATKRKLDELTALAKTARDESTIDSLVANVGPVVDEAVAQGQLPAAEDLLSSVYSATQKPVGRRYAKEIGEARGELVKTRRLWQQTEDAKAKLLTDPDDPPTNLTVGQWQCFHLGNWQAGLPHLAKGSDERLKQLAQQDLAAAASSDAQQQMAMADGWYDAAQKASEPQKAAMLHRAGHWYRQALPNVASQLEKVRLEKRLAEISAIPPPNAGLGPSGKLPLGRWVYVLGAVDPAVHVVQGTWASQREAAGVVTPAKRARFMLPVAIDGSYEVEVDFTSFDGKELSVLLPVGDRRCQLALANWGGKSSGINSINGKPALQNPTHVTPAGIFPNRRHQLSVRVELVNEAARIAVTLDGRPYLAWQGPQAALSQHPEHDVPNSQAIGLESAADMRAVFHTARIRLLSGNGKLLSAGSTFGNSR